MEWIIKSLKEGGTALVVIPDGILSNLANKNLRQFIINNLNRCHINLTPISHHLSLFEYLSSICLVSVRSSALPSYITFYEISVRQTRDLPVVSLFPHPASFRFHLTMDTLAVRLTLPTTKRVVDFHHQAIAHGGRTTQKNRPRRDDFCERMFSFLILAETRESGQC